MTKVLIVGGGPAGMASAIALAQAGVDAEIVEVSEDWRPNSSASSRTWCGWGARTT
jgi:2-polyprenyl-6-methoxyphenol hydroxylase-like FAD-dependent oxidoreductase